MAGICILMLAAFVILASGAVSANPMAPDPRSTAIDDPYSLALLLALVNLPLDLLMFAGMVYAAVKLYPTGAAGVCKITRGFMLRLLAAGLAIVVSGAVIDTVVLFEAVDFGRHLTTTIYQLRDPIITYAILASALVLISVAAAAIFVLRLSWKASMIPAAGITIINFIAWNIQTDNGIGGDVLFLTTFFAFVITPFAFELLRRWHAGMGSVVVAATPAAAESTPSAQGRDDPADP